jgi:branched-chain amino acid transport system substrate-binding protein
MSQTKSISRRKFIKTTAMAGAAVGATSLLPPFVRNAAAARDHILIGHPNPSTGPLADFGEASPWADERAIAAINKDGGIFIKEAGKKLPVKVRIVDTQSDPTKAGEAASKLILKDKVDLMVVMHTPDTVNPVTAMCERYEMPCISLDAPVEAWLSGGPYEWSFHAFWTIDTLSDIYIGMWEEFADKHSKVVGGLWPNDPDGKAWAPIFTDKLKAKGWDVVDPGRFPYFLKDFSSQISAFKKAGADILTGVLIPPDWTTAWRQCHQQGYIPKIASIGKAILFPSAVEALGGDLPLGLSTEIWWSPNHPFKSSLTGESAMDLCDAWTKEKNKIWNQPIGFKYAGFEIAADVLKRAQSLDKEAIREAIKQTDMNSIVGHIKYNDKNYSPTPLVGGQWIKGKKYPWEIQIVYNKLAPEIPLTADFIYPIPG